MISSLARPVTALLLLLLASAAHATPNGEPKVHGQLHEIMMMGKTGPNVKLSELPRQNVYAVGALSGLRGEVTILDGAVWLSYGNEDGAIEVQQPRSSEEAATLLVFAQVQRWQKVKLTADVPFAQLDSTVERLAKEKGLDVSKPLPVRIEGNVTELKWHSLKGAPPKPGGHAHGGHAHGGHAHGGHAHDKLIVSKTNPSARAKLVGFFSTRHHGIFTHMGENTHFHVVLPAEKQMGHVDAVTLKAGATVFFPR